MARGRKPKTETEIEEVVEEVVEQPTEIIDDMGGIVDISVTHVDEAAETDNVDEVKEETVVEAVAEEIVEDKPKQQRRSRREDNPKPVDETTSDEPAKTGFNPDSELPKDVIRQIIKLHNFTTVYRDEMLSYPLVKVYGDATLMDIISSKVLRVRVMFNGRPVIGYIKRGSVR
jgi:hypothetical protein